MSTKNVGQTLTATPGSTTGHPTPTRTWQWMRNGQPIAGATNSTYTLAEADIGSNINVKQIETNSSGSTSLLSNSVSVSALSLYAVLSYEPKTVADFENEYYRVNGSDTTFDNMFTHTRAGNATMVDSDGNLKWAPHNLLTDSNPTSSGWSLFNATLTADIGVASDGTTTLSLMSGTGGSTSQIRILQNTTSVLGVNYTCEFEFRPIDCDFVILFHSNGASGLSFEFDTSTGTATSTGVGANSGDWTEVSKSMTEVEPGLWLCSVTVSQVNDTTPAIFLYLSDSTSRTPATGPYDGYVGNIRYYRSDLGGMVDNPDRGDSYVPTTTAARYLPRRNHFRYNGSSYVKKGILLESAAATNLVTYSNTFSNGIYSATGAATRTQDTTGPDGQVNSAWTLVDNNAGGTGEVRLLWAVTVATSTRYTASIWAKADGAGFLALRSQFFTTGDGDTYFNLSTGAVATTDADHTATIEAFGNGWYRCSISFLTDAADTSGFISINVSETDGGLATVNRDSNSSIKIYGFQFELGSVPTSYIPTSGSTATRAAETLTIAGSNMAATTAAMSFHIQGEMTYADDGGDGVGLWSWYTSATDYIAVTVAVASSRTGEPTLTTENSNVLDQVVGSASAYSPGVNVSFNLAFRTTSSAINLARSGTAVTENATLAGLSNYGSTTFQMGKGQNAFTNPPYNGTIALFRQWDDDITDAGIESASA